MVALRQFERQAEREREQEREAQCLQSEHTKREILDLQKLLQEKDKDRNLLLVSSLFFSHVLVYCKLATDLRLRSRVVRSESLVNLSSERR